MKVAYHFTIPPPARPDLDAAVVEARLLAERFGGEPITFLYPAAHLDRAVPPWLAGLGHRDELDRLDREVDLHHVASHGLHPYPLLRRLTKPVVYSLLPSLGRSLPALGRWAGPARVFVAPSERDAGRLAALGKTPVRVALPGVDLARFSFRPPPPASPFVLMAGSAPWTRRQLRTKGVDLLLRTVRATPDLKLVFLWRGVLADEVHRLVRRYGVGDRVEVLDRRVDVDAVLASAHAAIVLARRPHLVKAYPHSLLEALAAGRPVLLSAGLGMADYVAEHRCGLAVEEWSVPALQAAVARLREGYDGYAAAARGLDLTPFGVEAFVARWEAIYREALAGGADVSA